MSASLRPVWAAVLAERGVLCPTCQTRWPSRLSLLTHRTAAGHWRSGR